MNSRFRGRAFVIITFERRGLRERIMAGLRNADKGPMQNDRHPPPSAHLDRVNRYFNDPVRARRSEQRRHGPKPATEPCRMVFPYFIHPWRRAAIVTLSGTVRGPADCDG